jgi:hypothetical protein
LLPSFGDFGLKLCGANWNGKGQSWINAIVGVGLHKFFPKPLDKLMTVFSPYVFGLQIPLYI